MKKLKKVVVFLLVASLVLGVIGCNNPSGPVSESNNGGQQSGNGANSGGQTGNGTQIGGGSSDEGIQSPSSPEGSGNGDEQQGSESGANSDGQTENGTQTPDIPEGFVLISPGTFQMGYEGFEDQPVCEVTITKPFYMGKYEITQSEYEKYCSYRDLPPSSEYGEGKNFPAYYVSWFDAIVYCNKRSIAENLTPCYSIKDSTNPEDWGEIPKRWDSLWTAVKCDWNANGYRLPTEAEWEYAARAGDNTVDTLIYSGTKNIDEIGDYAWYIENSEGSSHEVGTKKPNAFGLYDMTGNVCEWCWRFNNYDGYDETFDPSGMCRGGAWNYFDYCSVAHAFGYSSYSPNRDVGFRVVRSISE